MDKLDSFSLGGLVGMVLTSSIFLLNSPDISEVKVFERENRQSVIMMYRFGADGIYVEEEDNKYVPLSSYLNKIENKYGKKIEESEIKILVDF